MTSPLPHHVLHANQDDTVFLLDLPTSIAVAQNPTNVQSPFPTPTRLLLSRPALRTPYPTNEPAASRIKDTIETEIAQHSQPQADAVLHALYAKLVRRALEEVRALLDSQRCDGGTGRWFLPRALANSGDHDHGSSRPRKQAQTTREHEGEATARRLKRVREESGADALVGNDAGKQMKIAEFESATEDRRLAELLTYACEKPASTIASSDPLYNDDDDEDYGKEGDGDGDDDIILPSYHNSSAHTRTLHLSSPMTRASATSPSPTSFAFTIPPHSAFVLGDVTKTVPALRTTLRAFSPRTHGRADWLLLDPPWPNRSALRSRAYRPQYSVEATVRLLRRLDLDACIAPAGHVGVWITNRASCRAAVLTLFDEWNVELVEEWVWAKVTCDGEPVTMLGGTWRRPYEVLLVAQRPDHAIAVVDPALRSSLDAGSVDVAARVPRRVLAAVPDLHSRKPCLKWLVERLLVRRNEYVGVEVFARHLVAGWLSWGNEVLKYNWTGYWREAVPADETPVGRLISGGESYGERELIE